MGCSGSIESPNNSRGSLNAPSDYNNKSTDTDNLRKKVLKKQDHGETDSLGSTRSLSQSTGRDSGIDSAKTADGRRNWQTSNSEVGVNEKGDRDPLIPPNDEGGVVENGDTSSSRSSEGLKGGVAFEVAVNDDNAKSLIRKHPPKRLKGLEPIASAPKLTAEMLAEKQRLTEERRQEELLNRAKSSKKTSRRRKELLAAKDFDNQEQSQKLEQLDDKITSADRNREKHQAEIKNKQKQREMRAARARERARKLEEAEGEELNFDVEKDETFNADDDVDSWLDGDNNTNRNYGSATTTTTTASERIYSGRSSPTKQFQPLSSADARRKAPGSGVSDDRANNNQWAEQTDDFFDS